MKNKNYLKGCIAMGIFGAVWGAMFYFVQTAQGAECRKVSPGNYNCTTSNNISVHYATVTAYSPKETCRGGDYASCRNARGYKPVSKHSIACPRAIALGSRVLIQGRFYTCDDRTSRKYDGRFDIFTESHAEAVQWGKQRLEVTVIAH